METLLLRADGGAEIGAGHLLRCLALAQGWQGRGGQALFACASEHPALITRLAGEGIATHTVTATPGSRGDAEHTVRLAREAGARWVVVDGYHFDASYQAMLQEAGLQVLWIDDEAHAAPYVADLVLNQNLHATESLYARRAPSTGLLLGPRYALLRREFTRWRGFEREIPQVARRILVTLGGGDPGNVTLQVVQGLDQTRFAELQVQVVVGGFNPHLEKLRTWAAHSRVAARLLHDVPDMAELMAHSDLAISGAGSTAWELAFLGLPSCLVVIADNQRSVAEQLAAHGVAVDLGSAAELTAHDVAAAVQRLTGDTDLRQELATRGRRLVDGDGVARVVARLRGDALRLRPVERGDRRLLWEWANDSDVRAFAFHPQPIPWEDHVRWFDQKFASPQCFHFLALDHQDVPVGQVRFDVEDGGEAEIHVTVARHFRGCGYGSALLRLAAERLFRETQVRTIRALIQPQNTASLHAFEKAGWKPHGAVLAHHHAARQYLLVRSSKARGNDL